MNNNDTSSMKYRKNYTTIFFILLITILLFSNMVTGFFLYKNKNSNNKPLDMVTLPNTSPTPTIITTISPTITSKEYQKFYLSSDKSNFLEYPSTWSINTLEVKERPVVGPYREFPNEKKKDILVTYNLELSDRSGNKLLMNQYATNEPFADSTGDCSFIKDEDMAYIPKNNGENAVYRRLDSDKQSYTYEFATKSDCIPSNKVEGAGHTYSIQGSLGGHGSPEVSYKGDKATMREADEIFIENFLREKPLLLIIYGGDLK